MWCRIAYFKKKLLMSESPMSAVPDCTSSVQVAWGRPCTTQEMSIFIVFTLRQVMRPISFSVKWVIGILPSGLKRLARHSHPSTQWFPLFIRTILCPMFEIAYFRLTKSIGQTILHGHLIIPRNVDISAYASSVSLWQWCKARWRILSSDLSNIFYCSTTLLKSALLHS